MLYVCGHNRNRESRESGGLFVGVLCKERDEDQKIKFKEWPTTLLLALL